MDSESSVPLLKVEAQVEPNENDCTSDNQPEFPAEVIPKPFHYSSLGSPPTPTLALHKDSPPEHEILNADIDVPPTCSPTDVESQDEREDSDPFEVLTESDDHRELPQQEKSSNKKRLSSWRSQIQHLPHGEKLTFLKETKALTGNKLQHYFLRRGIGKEIEKTEKEQEVTTQIFNRAIKAGSVKVRNRSVLIMGGPGTGKTCLKCRILLEPLPVIRNSTALLQEPSCITTRDLSRENVPIVIEEDSLRPARKGTVKHIILEFISSLGDSANSLPENTRKQLRELVSSTLDSETAPDIASSNGVSDAAPVVASPEVGESSTAALPSSTSTANVQRIVDDLKGLFTSSNGTDPKDINLELLNLLDSGGQPQLCDLLPHFIKGLSIILVTLRLSDRLDDYPLTNYYEDGSCVGSYEQHLTVLDSIKRLVQSVQSNRHVHKKPKIMFIGTFYDQLSSEEGLEEKDAKLYDLFSGHFLKQLVLNGSNNKVVFPVNVLDLEEQEVVSLIQKEMLEVPPQDFEVPIWWYVLKLIIEKLTYTLKRDVLTFSECLDIAKQLDQSFEEDELRVALNYFHHMHSLHYYPEVLPNTVFLGPQIILDNLTELVRDVYAAKGAKRPIGGDQAFRQRGYVSFGLLSQAKFSKHYVENVFSAEDLLKIFSHLLIIAPLSCTPKSIDFKRDEFFMPTLLDTLDEEALDEYRLPAPAEPLLFTFPDTGLVRPGTFCCVQVHLLSQQGWTLCETDGKPDMVAQNCVMMSHSRSPSIITLIESFSYIEVYVRSEIDDPSRMFPEIRETVREAIDAANKILHYTDAKPKVAFLCPCSRPSLETSAFGATATYTQKRHIAEIRENKLRCSQKTTIYPEVTESHKQWITSTWPQPKVTAGILNAKDHLVHIRNAIYSARNDWKEIGRELFIEEDDLQQIEGSADDVRGRFHQMLGKWMQAGTATVNELLKVLEGKVIGRPDLAEEIRSYDREQKLKIGYFDY